MLFGVWTCVAQGNMYLMEAEILREKGTFNGT